ncbi:MAG: T9SS type A sorting domain-containing protein [Flavobacteriales bacterium]
MKRALLMIAAFFGTAVVSLAQVTGITVETFYTGGASPSVAGYPANHTTYRIYANTGGVNDRITTVSGNDDNPMSLLVSGSGIWNSPSGGGITGDASPCILYNSVPLAEYDSYVTVGVSCNDDGAANPVFKAEDVNQPWQSQAFNTVPYGNGEFVVNSPVGGTWFVLPDNPNSVAGSDLKVLLAQITTNGDICGTFYLQSFPNYTGAGSPAQYGTYSFSSNPGCTPGCTDNTALNFNAAATYDNGLCLLPCNLDLNALITTSPTCANSQNGVISATATGAQAFYEFTFNGQSQGLSSDGTEQFTGLGGGSFTVSVRDTRFDNVLANPNGLSCEVETVVSINVAPVTLIGSVGNAIECAGQNNGSVTTDAGNYGGGTGSLSFALFNSNGSAVVDGNNSPVVVSTPNYSGLTGGTYYFVATDAAGCTAQGNNFTIASPLAITMEASATGVGACYNSTDVTKVVSWFGGTGDVDFSLVNDGTYSIEGAASTVVLTGLNVGPHTLYAQDENGCTAEYTFNVVGAPEIVINAAVTSPSCNGDTDGAVTVTSTGGTGAIQYSFDGGSFSSNNTVGGLGNVTVVVEAQDANNCLATQTIEVVEPETLGANANVTNISCNGNTDGTISVEVIGGTFPYTYALNATPTPADASPIFTNLVAGDYVVNVIDANGCTYTASSASVVTEPTALQATATTTDVNCFGDESGVIQVSASGGTGAFGYSVNGGALSSNSSIGNLPAGDYEVVVYDANQCSVTVSNLSIDQPAESVAINGLTANPIDEDAGGSSPYTVSGGVAPYTYSWSGPGGAVVTGQDLTGLTTAAQAGNWVLTVTDANGCVATQTIVITGLNEMEYTYSISMYPNPNHGQFVLNMEGMNGEKLTYTIIDNTGRVVMSKELGNVHASRIESIDMAGAAAGIYQIRLVVGNDNHSIRFVKQ